MPATRTLGAPLLAARPRRIGWMPMDLDQLDALLDARTDALPVGAEPPTETICIPGYN